MRRVIPVILIAGMLGGGVFLAKRFIPAPRTGRVLSADDRHVSVQPRATDRVDASARNASGDADAIAMPVAGKYDRAALDRLFEDALTNPNPEERRTIIRGVAEFLAKNDVAKAAEFIDLLLRARARSGDADAYAFTQEFILKLAPRDPKAAIAWADVLPESLKDMSYQLVARAWVGSDPKAVADWVATVDHAGVRATVIRTMGHELRQSDPRGFGPQWAASLAQTPDGPRFSDVVVAQWAKSSPAAAAAWVATLPNGDDRDRGQLALVSAIAETDPTGAIAWGSALPPGEVRNRIIVEAVGKWAVIDPPAAANWADQDQSVPGLIESVFPRIASAWLLKDPAAAARWIEKAPVNPQSKQYISALSSRETTSR